MNAEAPAVFQRHDSNLPTVSVVIPMFNAADTIADALRSLQAQDLESWEAIVIDDGSNDGGGEIVREIARRDPRIRMERQDRRGPSAARNAAIRLACGAYLLFLDADSRMLSGGLSLLIEVAEASGRGAAYGGAAWFDDAGRGLDYSDPIGDQTVGLDEFLEDDRFAPHAHVIRRDLLGDLRFDELLGTSECRDLWLRLAERSVRWTCVRRDVAARCVAPVSRDWKRESLAAARVVAGSFARARRGSIDIDLTPEREHATVLRHALNAATAAAAHDRTAGLDRAVEVIRPFVSRGCLDAADAASAAHRCLPMAMGLPPSAWNHELARLSRLTARLWNRFEIERWTEPLFTGRATACLARRMVSPTDVAHYLADELDPSRPAVLIGFTAAARHLARLLIGRGCCVSARDDEIAEPMIEDIGGSSVVVYPGGTPLHAEAQYVCTLANDDEIVSSLPVCLDLIRWCEAREALFARTATRLLVSWPLPDVARREAA